MPQSATTSSPQRKEAAPCWPWATGLCSLGGLLWGGQKPLSTQRHLEVKPGPRKLTNKSGVKSRKILAELSDQIYTGNHMFGV